MTIRNFYVSLLAVIYLFIYFFYFLGGAKGRQRTQCACHVCAISIRRHQTYQRRWSRREYFAMESHQVYLIGWHNKSAPGMLSLSGKFRWTWCRVYNYVLYTAQRHLQSTPYFKIAIDAGRPQTSWKGNSTGTNKWEPHPHASGYFFSKKVRFFPSF